MQNSACTSRGTSTVDRINEAASRTAPAAVIQEWSGWGDRKNTSAGNDVWVSSMSTNHCSQRSHSSVSFSTRSRIQYRSTISTAEGGAPALISSAVTAASRLENAW